MIIIHMEDDLIHTIANPYCEDLSCNCHYDVEYHAFVIALQEMQDEVGRSLRHESETPLPRLWSARQ